VAFPVELVDIHVHVIVVPPSSKKSNITPTELTLDIEAIDEKISKELDSGMLRGMVEIFLKDPEPRPWIPPDSVMPGNQKFLTNLQIPSYRNNNPSLLLHNLDVCNDKEIEMIFGPGTHQYANSVVINCALNTSQHIQAGSFAIHLARGKPVACWKVSQNTGGFTSLELQMATELVSEIYETPWTMSPSIRDGCLTSKTSIDGNGLLKKKSTVGLPLSTSGKSWRHA